MIKLPQIKTYSMQEKKHVGSDTQSKYADIWKEARLKSNELDIELVRKITREYAQERIW